MVIEATSGRIQSDIYFLCSLARHSSKLLQHGRPQLFKGKNPSPTIARIEEPICVLLSGYLVYICDATEYPSLHLNREVLWPFCRLEGYAAGRMAVTPLQMRPQKETFYSSQTLRRTLRREWHSENVMEESK